MKAFSNPIDVLFLLTFVLVVFLDFHCHIFPFFNAAKFNRELFDSIVWLEICTKSFSAAGVLLTCFQYDTCCSASNNFTASFKVAGDENLSPLRKMEELHEFTLMKCEL